MTEIPATVPADQHPKDRGHLRNPKYQKYKFINANCSAEDAPRLKERRHCPLSRCGQCTAPSPRCRVLTTPNCTAQTLLRRNQNRNRDQGDSSLTNIKPHHVMDDRDPSHRANGSTPQGWGTHEGIPITHR